MHTATLSQHFATPLGLANKLMRRLVRRLNAFLALAVSFGPSVTEQLRQAFLQEVQNQAARDGYLILKVDNGLIEMLLIKRQTRIVVMSSSREWLSRDHAHQVMELMQADAAWVLDRSAHEVMGSTAHTLIRRVPAQEPKLSCAAARLDAEDAPVSAA